MPACTSSSPRATRKHFRSSDPRSHPHESLNSLKQIDIEFMRRLHTKVNLIPVIAKADTMTDEEIRDFKARVSIHDTARSNYTFDRISLRFLRILPITISTYSRRRHTTMRTKRPSQKPRKLPAKSLLPSSVLIKSLQPPMAAKYAADRTHGVSSRSTTRSTVTLSSSGKCSSELTWRSSGNTPTTSYTRTGERRNFSAWASRRTRVSSRRSSTYLAPCSSFMALMYQNSTAPPRGCKKSVCCTRPSLPRWRPR
jgi:hypothetical protein